MSKNPYIARIDATIARAPINQRWSSPAEAKGYVKAITQLKKELGMIKKELTAAKQQIRAGHINQRAHVGKGFGGGAMRGLFGAKAAGSINASTKNSMRNHELQVLKPYEEAERHLSNVLLGLDKMKLQMETWIMQQGGR
jgi:hypothetical protein